MNTSLAGKIATVTGGSTGIGLATAQELAAQGAKVYITGPRQAELDAAVAQIATAAVGIRADVSQLSDLDKVYAQIAKDEGRLDILFANAGGGDMLPLGAITEEQFDRILRPMFAVYCSPCKSVTAVISRIVDHSDRIHGVH